jgi:hypothetical protein
MKKIIIALAAVSALVAGASAAEANGRFYRYYGGNNHSYNHSYNYGYNNTYSFKKHNSYNHGYNNYAYSNHGYRNHGYSNYGYNTYYTQPVYSYDEPECHYVNVKKVFWQDGYKYIKFTTKQVCDYGY